jgi:hypothetical protein
LQPTQRLVLGVGQQHPLQTVVQSQHASWEQQHALGIDVDWSEPAEIPDVFVASAAAST